MPRDLVLVRHGESEGNIANKRSREGDNKDFTPEFRSRHTSQLRLSARGREQAVMAGRWITENIGSFDRHYVSEYVRAKETAARLGLPNAQWFVEIYLRERSWGMAEGLPDNERKEKFQGLLLQQDVNPFLWTPPNGESIADASMRGVERILDTLHRECSDKRVIIVNHGELMWGFRARLERMSQERFRELHLSKKSENKIHNGQVIHYTRVNPMTGELMPHLRWFRSVCPTDLERSNNDWQEIVRRKYTNEDLLEQVEKVTPIVT